jgi:hypothetical protein
VAVTDCHAPVIWLWDGVLCFFGKHSSIFYGKKQTQHEAALKKHGRKYFTLGKGKGSKDVY